MGKRSGNSSSRIWLCAIIFGLVGQIAWVVENMYFATLAQDIFSNSGRADMSYIVTTLMVIFSAVFATATTVVAGALSDKAGKRKPFLAFGYIIWGFTIMIFALLPMSVTSEHITLVAAALVAFDCIMTVAGSTSNDAAFNAWVADNTDASNRGRINSILAILPVIAVVIVFIGLSGFYSAAAESNWLFFVILGIIPTVAGIAALGIFRDSASIKTDNTITFKDFFSGFRLEAVRSNKMLYVCLAAACLIGISQQTFFSYLINFLILTLGLGDGFVIPMAVIIVGAAVITGFVGFTSDKIGRKGFYIPMLIVTIFGILSFYFIQFTAGTLWNILLYAGGILMMAGILSLTGLFSSAFQDYIPKGSEGRCQGIRMCFMVLIPMIIGPIISLLIGLDAMGLNGSDFVPPYSIFLAAAIVCVITIIPIIPLRRDADKLREVNEK